MKNERQKAKAKGGIRGNRRVTGGRGGRGRRGGSGEWRKEGAGESGGRGGVGVRSLRNREKGVTKGLRGGIA